MGTASYISYHTINGRIRSGACTTTSKFECRWDALGSAIRTTQYNSPNGSSRRYAAYGTPLQKYNYYSDFRMGSVGSFGYRRTVNPHAEQYIRARHYSYIDARWTTRDPIWPNQPSYGYVAGQSPRLIDPAGLAFLRMAYSGYIDSKKYGRYISLAPFLPGFYSSTDRTAFSKGTNRFQVTFDIESARVGINKVRKTMNIGTTHVYRYAFGKYYLLFAREGYFMNVHPTPFVHSCRSGINLRFWACAALAPPARETCVTNNINLEFKVTGKNEVTIYSRILATAFPSFDLTLSVDGRPFSCTWFWTDLYNTPGNRWVHPFIGLDINRSLVPSHGYPICVARGVDVPACCKK